MRVVLFTGKGGVGKTTAAAATATLAARRGLRALVVSTDAAHSLSDAFGAPVGGDPTEVAPGLHVQQVDAQQRFVRSWEVVQDYLRSVLDAAGIDRLESEELTVLPGAEEVLALFAVRDQVRSGSWDVVVVDCAPTAETLRLLALPEALGWYMERLFPLERRAVRSLRPLLTRVAGVPMPEEPVFDAVARLHADLGDVRRVLTAPNASVRLVLTPESVVVAEARRTLTSLALYGYRVDAVLANRIFPPGSADTWMQGWAEAQARQLALVTESFAPLPVFRSPYRASEPVGPDDLAAVAEAAYGRTDPFAPAPADDLLSIDADGDHYVLSLALPLADRRDLDLVRTGDELVVSVGGHRRVLALPGPLRRCSVADAWLRGGRLTVRFQPRADEWTTA